MASEKILLCSQKAIFGGGQGVGVEEEPQKGEASISDVIKAMFHYLGTCF